jgi:hypothetical protein
MTDSDIGIRGGSRGCKRRTRLPYFKKIFKIDREIFQLKKSLKLTVNLNVKRPLFPQILDPPLWAGILGEHGEVCDSCMHTAASAEGMLL